MKIKSLKKVKSKDKVHKIIIKKIFKTIINKIKDNEND